MRKYRKTQGLAWHTDFSPPPHKNAVTSNELEIGEAQDPAAHLKGCC